MRRPRRNQHVSLVRRIGLLMTTLTVLAVAAAGSSLWFTSVAARNVGFMRQVAEQAAESSAMQLTWLNVVGTLDTFSVTKPTPNAKLELDRLMADLQTQITKIKGSQTLGLTPARAEENLKIIANLEVTFEKMGALADEIYNLSVSNRWGTALQRRQTELAPLQTDLAAGLDRLNQNLNADLEQVQSQVRRSQVAAIIFSLAAGAAALLLTSGMARTGQRQISQPLNELIKQLRRITQGDYQSVEPLRRDDEIGELSESIAMMTGRLRESQELMEGRVAERTQALQRRTLQVQVAAQVARDIAAARNLTQLLNNAVDLIRERFDYYHAGIFLTDARGEYQILRAATGEAGREMLERKHTLRVGQVGLVGYAAHGGEARVSTDVSQDVAYFRNPMLPETRSEAAIPLKSAGRVIGVLDVQSREPGAFDPESLSILQVLADQLAIAIQNARLLEEIQKNLSDLQTAYGQLERQAWLKFLQTTPTQGYSFDGVEVTPLAAAPVRKEPVPGAGPVEEPAEVDSADTGEPALTPDVENTAAEREPEQEPVRIPLRVRGEEIGSLDVWPRAGSLSEAEMYLLATLSSRLSQTMESARLYEETQARAMREETINRLTASIARSIDLEGVLRSAAIELGKLPTVREAAVVIDTTLDTPDAADHPDPTGPADPAGSPPGEPRSNGRMNGGGNGHRA